MTHTIQEILEFISENDVKFIRLAFCDLFGTQKQLSIMPAELSRAFASGISFDASAIRGFEDVSKSDLFLFPDPSTLTLLPWRPEQGRVARFLCDIKNPDGSDYACDARGLLKAAVKRCASLGFVCQVGAECEFYLFKTDENGDPTTVTHDQGGYLDISPLDKGENIRRDICLYLEGMGIQPETSHHEQGPGQSEIDFRYSDALLAADNFITYKAAIKSVAARNGLYASFMPKPVPDKSGNGLHINLSLSKNEYNIFQTETSEYASIAQSFIEGILEKTAEITAFLNPIINSYDRLGGFEAPKYVSWSHQNRSQLIRMPAESGEKTRMELRSPDPAINPYLALVLIIHAGLDGIEDRLKLREPLDFNLYEEDLAAKEIPLLPQDLKSALEIAQRSVFVRKILGTEILDKYLSLKKAELDEYDSCSTTDDFYRQKYFLTL